ncbi:MAG: DUF4013 domain-containing protein, partial [Puniceicoccaceae bacterium]|nr:DUF4013 domain-containing protein [Puniceicoccaceae bacterium]
MKETPIFEEVFNRLIKLNGFWVQWLIGGLLSFVPIVNVFAFGYLYRMSRAVRTSGHPVLPPWVDWSGLFMDGLRFGVVWLLYWLLPLMLAAGITWFLPEMGLGAASDGFFLTAILMSIVLFFSAPFTYNKRQDFYA